MTNTIVRLASAALISVGLLSAPAASATEDMLTAIYDLDDDAVTDLLSDGEPVREEHYLAVLEVASSLSESEPREVWWREKLMEIAGSLADESEPDEATFEALREALVPDAEGLAAMHLRKALFSFIFTQGRYGGEDFESHLDLGADPLLRPAKGDNPDMFGYLIDLAQQKQESIVRTGGTTTELKAVVEHAWNEMRSHAEPPHVARNFLDAAITPFGEPIEHSSHIHADSGTGINVVRIAVRACIDMALAGMIGEVVGEDTGKAPVSWAQEYAETIEATSPDADIATIRLHVALGSLMGQADPDVSERVIEEVLAEGADPLASIEYGSVTANKYSDSFSYLVNIAEIAAAREEAGETEHLPDDWRNRAWRYHDAMAAAADAPEEAEYFLYRITGVLPAPPDDGSISSVVEAARRSGAALRYLDEEVDQDFANLTASESTDAGTEPDDRISYWQRYEREAYGGSSREIDP